LIETSPEYHQSILGRSSRVGVLLRKKRCFLSAIRRETRLYVAKNGEEPGSAALVIAAVWAEERDREGAAIRLKASGKTMIKGEGVLKGTAFGVWGA